MSERTPQPSPRRAQPSPRRAEVRRETGETRVRVALDLDGAGRAEVATGVGFLDHMLHLLARHAGFDLTVEASGDLHVDDHHTTEDVGIALGQALGKALGEARGVTRYASLHLPMDEALVLVALDLSGRPHLTFEVPFTAAKIGTFDTELVREFFQALANNARLTLHLRLVAGLNAHHVAEACFKGAARALRAAVAVDPRFADAVPSTKGVLGERPPGEASP